MNFNETFSIRLSDEWKIYIDKVPEGFEALGVVAISKYEVGALLHHPISDKFIQMNCANYRTLASNKVREAIDKIFEVKNTYAEDVLDNNQSSK